MMDLYPALTTGASSCIIEEALRLDLGELNRYMESQNVTINNCASASSSMNARRSLG